MSFLPLDLLCAGAYDLGIKLTNVQLDQFDRFAAFLVQTNQKFNLTRITEPDDIVTSHYLDSLTCLAVFSPAIGENVMDVGAGAGFPGIPIAIARPDLHITLLDAALKKVDFVNQAVEILGLTNAAAMHGRAEIIGREKTHREHYGVVFARALSETRVLAELCLPLTRTGGHVIAQKSTDIEAELVAARPIIGQLGGKIDSMPGIRIPGTEITRTLVIMSKSKPTPEQFPRSYARIANGKASCL